MAGDAAWSLMKPTVVNLSRTMHLTFSPRRYRSEYGALLDDALQVHPAAGLEDLPSVCRCSLYTGRRGQAPEMMNDNTS
jgi:hypothetical protein